MKSKSTKLVSILVIFALILGSFGCTPKEPAVPTDPPASETELAEAPIENDLEDAVQVEVPTESSEVTVIDQAERTVVIPTKPAKIISGYYISTISMMAMGLTDRIIAVEAKADSRPIYSILAPQLLDLPRVGTAKEFDTEGAIALEPDLVVAPKRVVDAANTLAEFNIPVVLVSPESHQELTEMFTLIGDATGEVDAATKLVDYYNNELDSVAALVKNVEEKPVVYMGANSSYLSTSPKQMYQSSLIEFAGGINASGNIEGANWAEVSYEDILAMNPDIIVIPSYAEYTKEDIKADTALAELTAVKNDAIYQMPGFIEAWDSPGPAGVLGLRWLVYAMNEELYSKDELDTKVVEFYSTFYNYNDVDTSLITK